MRKKMARTPRIDVKFIKYWEMYVDHILEIPGHNEVHFRNLELLCDLHLKYDALTAIINEKGFSYETKSRNGDPIIITRPEVNQLNTVTKQIAMYNKLLGFSIDKKTATKETPKTAPKDSEWT